MKKHVLFFALTIGILAGGCKKSSDSDNGGDDNGMVVISSDITASTTWTADKIYLLKGNVFVTGNATLTIEPGTIIKGDKATKGALIISRGSKITAEGTVDKPIVFTSSQPAGARAQGDWGGVILLGKANVNSGTNVAIEGIPASIGEKAQFGGTDDADNSGILKYVRIEFAGIPLLPDAEINGLTFGGVGSGTTIEYVEVYRSGDDSFEWFGGTVNCKHLLSIGAWDDDFDTDNGFSGKIQFGLAQRAQVVADVSGSNGFESDNDANGTANSPKTSAVFSNMTIVGPMTSGTSTSGINANFQHAAQIRRNSSISLFNSVFANYPEGIFIDDALPTSGSNSSANFVAGTLVIKNNLVYGCNAKSNEVKGINTTSKALFETALRADNSFVSGGSITDLLTDPLRYGSDFKASTNTTYYGKPNFTVKSGSAAASGAAFTHAKVADAFFEKVAYKGAFGTTDWTAGWASFDPQVLPYTTPGQVK
ncbi:hypothetical protein FW774_16560 [Pedobacter sp. BS3]|uniref:hypothetical protein n=1 Tax=Pedobacter sp. BS3 TaxID=2567937 RepID=UPI0011EC332E|nr:hypothetical protein [Pedobacter sp. BS3]TZF82296.1 hypothetical protein FW774_16560 [Pedobacter sp. BS3]